MNIELILEEELNREIARELIMEKYGEVDEARFEVCHAKANGNPWDTHILYDLIELSKGRE